ncbi:MAG TPA: DNA-3-methyladenine glycosylase 2 family protein [Candidatus Poseidoniaceae archaeon]|nr:MAG TPA: DNA-3-methyladenine glycosylase 2 family protein [Candidatus Poseidoniales archaeon]DAC69148.1 MAG TPA: DNA-3-methyladenine glycosylase 2 family protein [Candidatus Poseidoniales archaeon]HII30463.1 DNA-3-methyladenine glycosylase 2 family protein [Candidatus Poseidoniaceae archaeon]|tara:strand:- start:1113 stop:1724 length:612 start_codon:yes stop_codon:yes gene_type:complete
MEKGEPSWWSDAIQYFQNDDIMAECIETYGKDGLKGRGDLFYTIVRSIIGQQISVIAAESIWNRFETMVGQVTPGHVLQFSKEEIASCGITRPKSGYILGLANDSEELLNFPYATSTELEIRKHLIRFKGVGPWTAEMVMIFALLLPDVYSPKDIGLVNAIKRLFPGVESMDQAEEVAKRWTPYRTMACWYLWRTLDPIPVEY